MVPPTDGHAPQPEAVIFTDVDGRPARILQALDELDVITTAWIAGYDTGVSHGLAAHRADLHAAATHRTAARVVALVMDAPERDPAADKAAANLRAAWWAERRGETNGRATA